MEFDSALTFDSLVVGPANRLASAAARRAAESPGTSYNPLFLYSEPGLGKSHTLSAIAQYGIENHPDRAVMYQTLQEYLDELEEALKKSDQEAFRDRHNAVGILLLDDVQGLAGHTQAQEMLLRTIDGLTGAGAQVVLASDRPPSKINGLDGRLLTRFSGGLIVDIGRPDHETRAAIVRTKAGDKGANLGHAVAETLALAPVKNVTELQEALSALISKQESEGRTVSAKELAADLGVKVPDVPSPAPDAPGAVTQARDSAEKSTSGPDPRKKRAASSKSSAQPPAPAKTKKRRSPVKEKKKSPPPKAKKSGATRQADPPPTPRKPEKAGKKPPAEVKKRAVPKEPRAPARAEEPPSPAKATAPKGVSAVRKHPWRKKIEDAAGSARADSIAPTRILKLLSDSDPPDGWEAALAEFEMQVARVREIRLELKTLGDPWPEVAATLLTDPDRLLEAENLLTSARERARPFPPLPESHGLRGLGGRFPALAVKATEQLLRADPSVYNPLFVHSPDKDRALAFLHATGASFIGYHPEGTGAIVSVQGFAEEFVAAISNGVAGAWRERWWSLDLLLLHGVEESSKKQRVQEEVFHLLEALSNRGARIVLASDRAPAQIADVPERLASRLEDGLVVDLGDEQGAGAKRAKPKEPVVTESSPAVGTGPDATAALDDADGEDLRAVKEFAGVSQGTGAPTEEASGAGTSATAGESTANKRWLPSPERVVWDWPVLEDRIVDEVDEGRVGGSDGD